jgi:spore coat protein U-like protein
LNSFSIRACAVLELIFMNLSTPSGKALRTAMLASIALTLSSLSAVAATTTATFGVTATVQASCSVSASTLSFGSYNGSMATATSAVSVTCTNSTPYNVGLSAGVASGATVAARKMTGPASALLSYSLFSDPSRSINWGQTVGSDTVTGRGNGAVQALTVYGQASGGQYLAPGSYADTVVATITY